MTTLLFVAMIFDVGVRFASLTVGTGQEGDPSSRKALLWMTAKGGLGGEVVAVVTALEAARRVI